MATETSYRILRPHEHVRLDEGSFGMPGLVALESIGPFAETKASGPILTVHDSTVEAGLGIGHHPHRWNERLFYIEAGELDHDDAMNGITGHMDTGDVGQFVEGRRGMVHSEWNHGDVDTRAYILVYATDPIPERTAFHVLKDADAPRYDEAPGVRTKELVGPRSPLEVHGDIRAVSDAVLDADAVVTLSVGAGEGGLGSVREGRVRLDGEDLEAGTTIVLPVSDVAREVRLKADGPSRVVRIVHGPG
ncbi:MAG TPA: pirin family protein [Actinomycetota bacterium]|nr:pirin family protein [Actinomycetota bacterium]